MRSKLNPESSAQLVKYAISDGTPRCALVTALIVGTVLTAINQGDQIIEGAWPPPWKVLLTYCVPYCVTTWGAICAKRATTD
jgi:hypothetical protein